MIEPLVLTLNSRRPWQATGKAPVLLSGRPSFQNTIDLDPDCPAPPANIGPQRQCTPRHTGVKITGVHVHIRGFLKSAADSLPLHLLLHGMGQFLDLFRLLNDTDRQGLLVRLIHVLLKLGGQLQQLLGVLLDV